MFKNRRAFWTVLFVLGLATLYPYAKGMAESKDASTSENELAIKFGDPTHVFFFNHQNYLTQHKLASETPETWNVLPSLERLRKVKDGEALLEKLHADLVAKQVRTPEEDALFQAVWGKANLAVAPSRIPEAAMSKKAIPATESVTAFSKKIGDVKDWNLAFDGGQHSSAVDAVQTSGRDSGSKAGMVNAASHKTQIANIVPPTPAHSEGNGSMPISGIAIGALLLVGTYAGAKAMRSGTSPQTNSPGTPSPAHDQLEALNDLIADPRRRAEFMDDHNVYMAKHGVTLDPEIVKMTHSTLQQYEQKIAALQSGDSSPIIAARGVETAAATAVVSAAAALVSAAMAMTAADSAAKTAKH